MKGGGRFRAIEVFRCGDGVERVSKGSKSIKGEKLFCTERGERYGEDVKPGERDGVLASKGEERRILRRERSGKFPRVCVCRVWLPSAIDPFINSLSLFTLLALIYTACTY